MLGFGRMKILCKKKKNTFGWGNIIFLWILFFMIFFLTFFFSKNNKKTEIFYFIALIFYALVLTSIEAKQKMFVCNNSL